MMGHPGRISGQRVPSLPAPAGFGCSCRSSSAGSSPASVAALHHSTREQSMHCNTFTGICWDEKRGDVIYTIIVRATAFGFAINHAESLLQTSCSMLLRSRIEAAVGNRS